MNLHAPKPEATRNDKPEPHLGRFSVLPTHVVLTTKADLVERVNDILVRVDELTVNLVDCLAFDVGFGWQKAAHMRKLATEYLGFVLEDRATDQIDPKLMLLTVVVARTHDIGRHLQQLAIELRVPEKREAWCKDASQCEMLSFLENVTTDLQTDDLQKLHGLVSRRFLEHFDVLRNVEDGDRQAILDAIEWHNRADVDLPRDSLAWKMCAMLRDHDAAEILRNPGFITKSEFMVSELCLHFLPHCKDLQVGMDRFEPGAQSTVQRQQMETWVRAALVGADLPENCSELAKTVWGIVSGRRCTGGGNDENLVLGASLEELVRIFSSRRNLHIDTHAPTWSYPYYMLGQLSMIFGINDSEVVKSLLKEDGVRARLEYLRRTMPEGLYERVETTLRDWLKSVHRIVV